MRLALNTWERIRVSRNVNYQLKEESITDLLVLELKSRHQKEVKTKTFTKDEEGKNGADWEWWFKWGNKFLGFRVQAKIIDINTDRFEHLHYYKKSKNSTTKKFQCDKLIKNALEASALHKPCIPIYCLYLHKESIDSIIDWKCGSYSNQFELLGCSLINALEIKKLRDSKSRDLESLSVNMRPWHCLVCCSGYNGADPIDNMNNYAKRIFPIDSTIAKDLKVDIPDTFITDNPPSYIKMLLNDEENNNIKTPDKDLYGVIIYSLDDNLNCQSKRNIF